MQKLHTCYNAVMLTDTTAVRAYFAKLGLETEIADLYLALHSHGPQTISELSRNSKVERTRIYRLIDKLLEANLIEVESHHKRGVIKAAPIANLHILINQKEQELKGLQDELELIQQVLATNSLSSPATRVQFYRGAEGIRQMRWNELRAKAEILGYVHRIFDEGSGRAFMERWVNEFEAKELHKKVLFNEDFITSWRENKPKVIVQRCIQGIEYHSIDPKIFTLAFSCDIYDNVVSYCNWKDGEVFGIEIYNQEIADAQRQFFNILWPQSTAETRI